MLKNLLNRFKSAPPAEAPPPAPAPASALAADDVALADALVAEGNQVEDAGDLPAATVLYRQAVAAAPGHARGHLNLGIALAARGDAAGAAAAYERVLAIDPQHPFGHYNLARLRYVRHELAPAEASLRAALRAKPEFPQALVLLASALDDQGKTAEAIDALRAALALQPDDAGGWFNLGTMLRSTRRLDEADEAARHAFALDGRAEALRLSSLVLRDHGFMAESREPLRAAIAAEPGNLGYPSDELMLLNFDETIAARDLFERHVAWGRRLEQAHPVRFREYAGDAGQARRRRIGYVSGDFNIHPVALFMQPVLEHHDRAAFEVFCYSSGTKNDSYTEQVRRSADHWIDARDLGDDALADRIHADGIDILVDLTGHTQKSRLGAFAQRPAPVQATWLGYLNTTGMTRMDWRITDRRSDPPELAQPLHTETLAFLPESQWCYRPFVAVPVAVAAPVERHGHVTFGSFNNAPKITAQVARRWGQLLARTPGSRLLVADVASERKRAAIRAELEAQGVAPERVDFAPRVELNAYYASYGNVDIALDTFPYGGGTTTLDALWMGVPVVAARGPTPVSRSAAGLLAALGMDDWIADSVDDFVDVAVRQAADIARIAALRRSLRATLQASPLMDEVRFVRALEALYGRMWDARPRPS